MLSTFKVGKLLLRIASIYNVHACVEDVCCIHALSKQGLKFKLQPVLF